MLKKAEEAAKKMIAKGGIQEISIKELCKILEINPGAFHHHIGMGIQEFREHMREMVTDGGKNYRGYYQKRRENREAERKQRILDAAIRIGSTNANEVAREAGVARTLIYRYFGTMENFREAVECILKG